MRRLHGGSPGRLLLGLVCLGLAGCGPSGEKLVRVEGKVMLGDQPLTTGTVILSPDAAKGNQSLEEPRGEVDANGTFKVYTGRREGVSPGAYKVAVTAAEQVDPNNPYFTKWLIPEKYIDFQTSGLSFAVAENDPPGTYDLKLSPK
jgi:hypothetical protein